MFCLMAVAACTPGGGVQLTGSLSFAPSFCEATRALEVHNADGRERRLVAIRRLGGAPVRAVPFLDEAQAAFELVPMTTLAPSERTVIPVIFRPRTPGALETTLEFDFEGQRLAVTLSASALATPQLPSRLDFGAVARGDAIELPLDAPPPLQLAVRGASFQASGDQRRIVFSPFEARVYSGTAMVTSECGTFSVTLVGVGVDSVLTVAPTSLEFEPTLVGSERTAAFTFANLSRLPIGLRGFERTGPSAMNFRAAPLDGGVLIVPPARRSAEGDLVPGEAVLPVIFSPDREGTASGSLALTTPLRTLPMTQLPLRGLGGGPDIEVLPTSLQFPPVTTVDRARLTIRNVGTVSSDPRLHLRLGATGGLPVFETVTVSGTGTLMVDFVRAGAGTTPLASGESVEVEVTVGPGPGVHHLRVLSNDPDEPVVTVVITTQ
jgi:hypothetical protein